MKSTCLVMGTAGQHVTSTGCRHVVTRFSYPRDVPTSSPRSLDTLLEFVRDERTKQIEHFDALDNKAGIVLGFAGLLITLAPDVPTVILVPALIAAASAAAFSLAAFWPRPHASLQPTPMRKYLSADDRFTRQRLFDTLEVLVNTISDDLATKARRLKWALMALTTAAGLLAAGILAEGLQGS